MKQKIERTVSDVSSENHAMCILLECWKSQPFLREIAAIDNFLEWRRFAQWKFS